MQKITYITSVGRIEIDDVNTSSIDGERVRCLRLNEFDGNSAKNRIEAVRCIDMPGQRTLSALPEVKTISAKISFAPISDIDGVLVCTGAEGMYRLRNEVLRHFPLGETATLVYINDNGFYTITARIDEKPVFTVKDGYLCECTMYFTADYPYWCKTLYSKTETVVTDSPAIFEPPEYGEIESPVGGMITCIQSQSNEGETGTLVNFENQYVSRTKQIRFCRPLQAGEILTFSFLYNNEWSVLLNGSAASDFVYFDPGVKPCTSIPGQSTFKFISGGGGELAVQLIYRNLFVTV